MADTGEINLIEKYKPEDATTNPTLILKTMKNPEYNSLISEIIHVIFDTVHNYNINRKSKKNTGLSNPKKNYLANALKI